MILDKQLLISLVLSVGLFTASTAAADTNAHKGFVSFVFVGCMPSVVMDSSLKTFVKTAHLAPAKPELAEVFLRGNHGEAYVPTDRLVRMIILKRADGSCTVAAPRMADIEGLVSEVEKMLVGPGSPFQRQSPTESKVGNGVTVTNRAYNGQLGNQKLYVLLSTTPDTRVVTQAMITISRVKN